MKYSEDRLEELLKHEGIVQSEDNISWDNSGNGNDFSKFVCYYCLNKFDTWEESRECGRQDLKRNPNMIPLQMVR